MRDTNLVNSLREHAEWAWTNEWETLITLCDDLAVSDGQASADQRLICAPHK